MSNTSIIRENTAIRYNSQEKFDLRGFSLKDIQEESKAESFPVHVFPDFFKTLITQCKEVNGFPIDYAAGSILFAAATCLGNTRKVEVKNGWIQSPVFWLALVGPTGVRKSQPMDFAIRHIIDEDIRQSKLYREALKEYRTKLANYKPEDGEEPEEPREKRNIIQDITFEKLCKLHEHNPKGLGLYMDELDGWFSSFDRYNSTGEESKWLSLWTEGAIIVDRKSEEPIAINSGCVSVIGSVQRGIILKALSKGKKAENGFIDRVLFLYPNDPKAPCIDPELALHPSIKPTYKSHLEKLIELGSFPRILPLTDEGREEFFKWYNEKLVPTINSSQDEFRGMYPKMATYAARFALILEILEWVSGSAIEEPSTVSKKSVLNAIDLVNYFISTGKKARIEINSENPLMKMSKDKQDFFKVLPNEFKTGDALEVASAFSIPERTVKDFLAKYCKRGPDQLLERVKRGHYSKMYE